MCLPSEPASVNCKHLKLVSCAPSHSRALTTAARVAGHEGVAPLLPPRGNEGDA